MGKPFRVRVKTGKAPAKIRKGSSAASCPSYSKNRELAKAQRTALRQRLVAVDDRISDAKEDGRSKRALEANLTKPLEVMDIEKSDRASSLKNAPSMQSLESISRTKSTNRPEYFNSPNDLDVAFTERCQALVDSVQQQARVGQRIKAVNEIRALLKHISPDDDSATEQRKVVGRYAKNLLPILFKIYTNIPEKGAKDATKLDNDRDLKLSVLETIRIYIPLVPKDLLNTHADLALKKMQDDSIPEQRKWFIIDILVALCRGVGSEAAETIFTFVHTWFLTSPTRRSLQKKAYRILSELYKRREDSSMEAFFVKIQPTVMDILRLEANTIAESAWAPRLAVFRLILRSLGSLEECEQFYNLVFTQIILCMDRNRNSLTRQNAAKCFQELVTKMMEFAAMDNENAHTLKVQVLDSVESRIFAFADLKTNTSEIPLEQARAALIAMNIFAQQNVKSMNGALVSRFLNHAIVFLEDDRPVIRVLAIRLMRIFCRKLPDFILTQFQSFILESIFNNQHDNSATIRKANRFLFETLIEKFGYEVVCKYASGDEGLLKFLKKLEKMRRKKLTPASSVKSATRSMVSGVDAASDFMSAVTQSKTIRADSIFNHMKYSDDDGESDEDEDDDDLKSRYARSSICLKEDKDDVLDLMDRKSLLSSIVVSKAKKQEKKSQSGLRFASDGRIIIDDEDDEQGPSKKKKKAAEESSSEEDDSEDDY